jgi:hydrophobic/amphiphilic exporter-1 (mainly G- bacteria), HAE1 family
MLTGVLLGVFIIPVLFVIFQNLHEKVSRKAQRDEIDELEEQLFNA